MGSGRFWNLEKVVTLCKLTFDITRFASLQTTSFTWVFP